MATQKWKCMQCEWTGKPEEVKEDGHGAKICPECGDEDIFQQRYFKCLDCDFTAEQYEFFPELCADQDPTESSTKDHYSNHKKPDTGVECISCNWKQIA